jgi:serine/threonine protein kinase
VTSALAPSRIGPYTVTGVLGTGGNAVVYRGWSRRDPDAAIKVARPGSQSDFAREFALARHVDAAFIAPHLGYGSAPGGPYLAMRYLSGYASLGTTVGGLPTDALWEVATGTARAIAAVHAAGLIHCDVKPANLLVRGPSVRLIDFGIARTQIGQRPGGRFVHCSRGWAAPEQLSPDPLTPAVDIFAWGCVVAYLAAGVHPYASTTETEWVLRLRSSAPDLFGLPPNLAGIVSLALQQDPRRRPTARALLDLLARARAPQAPVLATAA